MSTGRWRLVSIAAGLFALGSMFGALVLLPARAQFDLTALSGNLSACEDGFCLDDQPIYFGPEWYLRGTISTVDHNRDGLIGSLFDELSGLVGADVLTEVSPNGAVNEVYVLNGVSWRGIAQEAPWADSEELPGLLPPSAPDPLPNAVAEPGTSIEGELVSCGSGWCISGQALYLGPWWFLQHGSAAMDFDTDGMLETPAAEMEGLAGSTVIVEGRLVGDDYEIFTLNGNPWRPATGPPPWSGGPTDLIGPTPDRSPEEPDNDPVAPNPQPEEAETEPAGDEDDGPVTSLPAPADHDRPPVPADPGPPAGVPAGP